MDKATCGAPEEWHGCYSGAWDIWTAESFQHPAKMAPGLCHRIFDHLEELGLLQPGMQVLDFLAGIATSGLVAASRGYPVTLLELEEKFVKLARANMEALERKMAIPPWEVIQGDARHLSELLQGQAAGVVSPPYHQAGNKIPSGSITEWKNRTGEWRTGMRYSDNPANIGNLKDEPIGIVSPPYSNAISANSKNPEAQLERWVNHKNEVAEKAKHWSGGRDYSTPGRAAFAKGVFGGYGKDPANIGNLPDVGIVSPPFMESHAGSDKLRKLGKGAAITEYGSRKGRGMGGDRRKETTANLNEKTNIGLIPTIGNKGRDMPEYYLSAMCQVYAEAFKVCNVLVIVVKDPTRNKMLRPLGQDTIALLEEVGYKIVCVHRAILFEEQEGGHLFEGTRKKVKGRMSFFKRLQWRKGNSELARWEWVIVARREG